MKKEGYIMLKISKIILRSGIWAALFMVAGMTAVNAQSITGSAHDLSGNTGDNGEICVYCHTPHASNTAMATVPLWNKVAGTATLTSYSSITLEGTISAAPGGISLACLSCHDGSQAMDTVVNAPGSGGVNILGAAMGGVTPLAAMTGFTAVGADDMQNDHPISIVYAGAWGATAAVDQSMNAADWDTGTMYWVELGAGNGVREKTDMILYNDGSNNPRVECATCHDPHNDDNGTFLRIANAGSNVCFACHNK
jgi:predicted CXXCH cytochrome family protein